VVKAIAVAIIATLININLIDSFMLYFSPEIYPLQKLTSYRFCGT
jgi:hypothetical protein